MAPAFLKVDPDAGGPMKRTISFALVALIAGLTACGRGGNKADTTLNTDLSLAAQQKGFKPIDSLGPAERAAGGAAVSGAPLSNVPQQRRTRSAGGDVASHRSTSSAPARSSSGETVVKHTQRDAAIGAAAGAVIGATTSRNKVKGGVIGGIVGGILGGVIGNNVDKTKKKKP
jgi:hypothetical protein